MRKVRAGSLLLGVALVLLGCDHLRTGGAYSLTPRPPRPAGPATAIEADGRAIRTRVETWLSARGYHESPGKQAVYWNKRASHVIIYPQAGGEIKVAFSAFGNRRDLRLSEETERDLLAYLQTLPGVQVAPTEFPNPNHAP
jgi:hypothetical protein